MAELAPGDPSEIRYVGDHRDYDIKGASDVGLRSALGKRGPWGPSAPGDRLGVSSPLDRLPGAGPHRSPRIRLPPPFPGVLGTLFIA
ncbi:hypothetical protein [Paractinoplanes ferrugineus]|uniref:hypothetical protein n=1 Tax=Paractinoplanes ferrugineus TaxID=113564 RepID=UPI001EF36BA6|nr:hypothetical protein [Actinoplanes ferrugineus]